MWVFIVLLLIGCTIIVTRTFLNGAREAEPVAREAAVPQSTPARVGGHPATAGPLETRPSTAARPQVEPANSSSAYPPPVAERPGDACPKCGTETVPGAKFCGECGRRLVS